MLEILNKKTINLKNLLFLFILFILMILNFSFIKVSADDKNTVNDSQDNLVKEQLRQLAKEVFDIQTEYQEKDQEFDEALTKTKKILEECENTDAESKITKKLVEFNNINIDLNNKLNEIQQKKIYELNQDIYTKYNFKLEPEQIEKIRQIAHKFMEGKTEDITTLTNEEAEFAKIELKIIIENIKNFRPFINDYIIAINNFKKRIKSAKTATNPKTEITQAIAEYKKTLEEKLKELKKNIEKQTVKKEFKKKIQKNSKTDEEEKHEQTDKPFYKKIWFWATLTTLTILIIASCGFFIYKKNKKSKIKNT